METLRAQLAELFSLHDDRATEEEITERIHSGATLKGSNMCILVLAIFIASIGLNMNSTAVVIGAMLISPLMGAILAIGYGMAVYNIGYVRDSAKTLLIQVVFSLLASAIYFYLSPIHTPSAELIARTEPTTWDVLIATFGGLAGIIGLTRAERGNVIPGVAIATALMPPLCTAGYGIAHQSGKFFFGALYLFFINAFFICFSAYLVLKILNLSPKERIDEALFQRQRKYLLTMGVLILLPSLYMAWQSVRENLADVQAKEFVQQNFRADDLQAVSHVLRGEKKELEVLLLGRMMSAEEIGTLREKMEEYSHLRGMELKIVQNDTSGMVREEDLQNIVASEWNSVGGAALADTQEELKKYKQKSLRYAPAYQQQEKDRKLLRDISAKAKILFPAFLSVEGASLPAADEKGNLAYPKFLAVVRLSAPIEPEEEEKLRQWFAAEAGKPVELAIFAAAGEESASNY